VAVQNQPVCVGTAEIIELAQQFLDACALKADVAAQHSVIHQEQFSAVLEQVTSVIHNTAVTVAELSVTMVQEQDHAVQKPGAEILINVADSVAPHSLLVILTVLVQHTITWQFLQDYLPVMAV
jgi:repressor of nif and glnA expression